MSLDQLDPITNPPSELERRYWAILFGGFIQQIRARSGRSVEQLAHLAGMETSEWMALEAGELLPQTEPELRTLAGALEISFLKMADLMLLCSRAWGK